MAVLGGSPLGLVGSLSVANNVGQSSFNDAKNKNVDVNRYNRSEYGASRRGNSLFTGDRVVRAWPGIESINSTKGLNGTQDEGTMTGGQYKSSYKRRTLHNNDIYDVSLLNIIEKLQGTQAALKMTDFAYLKNVGVFPNNRLMVARRFSGPIGDNLMRKSNNRPLAVCISWLPQESDFIKINFGEKWTEAEADFKEVLNKIGGDFTTKGTSGLGDAISGAGDAVPLPGFTEVFQRKFLEKMGVFDNGASDIIPSGNPNLIKEAKKRTTVGYEMAGSGLTCTVSIEMTCEWELKFISGIDPTIVWMDILGTVTRFGTSPSVSYGLSKKVGQKAIDWMNDPNKLVKDIADFLAEAVEGIKEELTNVINKFSGDMIQQDANDKAAAEREKAAAAKLKNGEEPPAVDEKSEASAKLQAQVEVAKGFLESMGSIVKDVIVATVKKYRVEIIGIINSLTGLPSTPWHITIGNPMRPVFCSGDMITQDVILTLGPTLAFNDLPSSIKAVFTLTNARSWGMQEIMAKFNSGYLRTVDSQKSFYETKNGEVPGQFPFETIPPSPKPDSGTASNAGTTASSTNSNNTSNVNSSTSSKESPGVTTPDKVSTKEEGGKVPVDTTIPPTVGPTLPTTGNNSPIMVTTTTTTVAPTTTTTTTRI